MRGNTFRALNLVLCILTVLPPKRVISISSMATRSGDLIHLLGARRSGVVGHRVVASEVAPKWGCRRYVTSLKRTGSRVGG